MRALSDLRAVVGTEAADPPVRAALMNGVRKGRRHGVVVQAVRPTEADGITTPRAAVLADLAALAETMTASARAHVARAGHGDDVDARGTTWDAGLAWPTCRMARAKCWPPSEVIELCAQSPHASAGARRLAILLVNQHQA